MDKISIDLVLAQLEDGPSPVSHVTRIAIRGLLEELKTLRQNEDKAYAMETFIGATMQFEQDPSPRNIVRVRALVLKHMLLNSNVLTSFLRRNRVAIDAAFELFKHAP